MRRSKRAKLATERRAGAGGAASGQRRSWWCVRAERAAGGVCGRSESGSKDGSDFSGQRPAAGAVGENPGGVCVCVCELKNCFTNQITTTLARTAHSPHQEWVNPSHLVREAT
jgi:hypothetical protein